jgi:ABC-2 type transport system permease protein
VDKLLAVVRREFLERVRTRWFWISSLVVPAVFGALLVLPAMLTTGGAARRVAVVDATESDLGDAVVAALAEGGVFHATRVASAAGVVDSLVNEVGAKRLDGVLILTEDAVTTGAVQYRASNVSSIRDINELERVLGDVITVARLKRVGIDPAVMARAQQRIHLETAKISRSQTTAESAAQSFSLAYFMGIILYTVILMYGVNVKSSVLEEKTTRIVEVLVSSIRPFPLLVGKVVGVGAVSLLQLTLWAVLGRLVLGSRRVLSTRMPDDLNFLQVPHVSVATGAVFIAYFLGGFFIYSAMFAAVGAMSSSEQEAQQAQQPLVLVLVLSFLSMFALLNDPGSALGVVLSMVPFTSPIAMPVRWAAGDLPPIELAASLVLLVAGIAGVTWVAARIYRVGILMTGKRPGVRELWRWVRAG